MDMNIRFRAFGRALLFIGLSATMASGSGCRDQSSPTDSSSPAEPSSTTSGREGSGPAIQIPEAEPAVSSLRFRSFGKESGFDFVRNDEMHGQERIFEVNGGGAAIFDFDADGSLDIYMTNGCRVPLSLRSKDTPGKLFRNKKEMKFFECSQPSGLMQYGFSTGCAAGDVNEDGFEDLYIAAFGPNELWINHGDGSFSRVAGDQMPAADEWSSSVAFADLNSDCALDLYVANYLVESDTNPKLCRDSKPGVGDTGCTPPYFDGVCDRLLLSNGKGAFLDSSTAAGLSSLPGKGLGVAIGDFGGDPGSEIFVANDGEANFMFHAEHVPDESEPDLPDRIILKELAVLASVALDERGYAQANMGVAVSDLDRNGLPDIFVTHFYGETNTLYLNHSSSGALLFQDATRMSGLGPPSLNRLAFGVAAIDVDNNGWKDLLIANGHTNDRTWSRNKEPFRMAPQLFLNQGGAVFVDVSGSAGEYFQLDLLGRGMAIGDLDRDGRIDAVVSQQLDPSVILQNVTRSAGNSLVLKLVGRTCCRTPVTARVTLRGVDPQACEQLVGGGSFQSASANEIHFGLADAKKVDLEILWPGGDREIVTGVEPGYWTIRQGDLRVFAVD